MKYVFSMMCLAASLATVTLSREPSPLRSRPDSRTRLRRSLSAAPTRHNAKKAAGGLQITTFALLKRGGAKGAT